MARAKARETAALQDGAENAKDETKGATITAKATVLSAVDQSHRRSIVDLVSERGALTPPRTLQRWR